MMRKYPDWHGECRRERPPCQVFNDGVGLIVPLFNDGAPKAVSVPRQTEKPFTFGEMPVNGIRCCNDQREHQVCALARERSSSSLWAGDAGQPLELLPISEVHPEAIKRICHEP